MTRGYLEIEAGRKLTPDEKSIANLLVDENRYVVAKRVVEIANTRSADFEVDGVSAELKTISHITSSDIASALARRILEGVGQAARIIVDARGTSWHDARNRGECHQARIRQANER